MLLYTLIFNSIVTLALKYLNRKLKRGGFSHMFAPLLVKYLLVVIDCKSALFVNAALIKTQSLMSVDAAEENSAKDNG